ncbi:MAG: BglII/BstYI family type II restriction endonuclease [bacterium]
MRIAAEFSFNNGSEIVRRKHGTILKELVSCINSVDASRYMTKKSKEKTMPGRMLYNPRALNKAFDDFLVSKGWVKHREKCDYPRHYYTSGYEPSDLRNGAFREMDFVKNRLGVEVQFGKYAFMVYNVCAKMTIFHNLGIIDEGVEIVPVKAFADQMSTGVSYFEQFVWDLERRGVADIDIPVLIFGIDK